MQYRPAKGDPETETKEEEGSCCIEETEDKEMAVLGQRLEINLNSAGEFTCRDGKGKKG
jgi:hypothetical protein